MAGLVVSSRNARFQQWQALLTNRSKRHRAGEFVVHGVRPITMAVEQGWPVRFMIYADGVPLSQWARKTLDRVDCDVAAVVPELLRELGDKAEEVPELVAVAEMPPDRLDRIPAPDDALVVVFDRPSSPGNIGTLVRSADALGASGVIISGHSADPYDPKAVRASTGSIFAIPVVRARSTDDVATWARSHSMTIVGTDETATVDVDACDLTGPRLIVIGNETTGLSAAWRTACDITAAIPIQGSASSLNAAAAGTVMLYEAKRQRRHTPPLPGSS